MERNNGEGDPMDLIEYAATYCQLPEGCPRLPRGSSSLLAEIMKRWQEDTDDPGEFVDLGFRRRDEEDRAKFYDSIEVCEICPLSPPDK